MDMKVKHLEMVQSAIARMSQHSFFVKGWSITLTVAILAVAFDKQCPLFAIVAMLPIGAFWGMDAFYVRHERIFRNLHRKIAEDIQNNTNLVPLFDMTPKNYHSVDTKWHCCFRSHVVWPLYTAMALIAAVIFWANP